MTSPVQGQLQSSWLKIFVKGSGVNEGLKKIFTRHAYLLITLKPTPVYYGVLPAHVDVRPRSLFLQELKRAPFATRGRIKPRVKDLALDKLTAWGVALLLSKSLEDSKGTLGIGRMD